MINKYLLELDPISSNAAYSTHAWVDGNSGKARHIRFLQDFHREWKDVAIWLMYLQDLDRNKISISKDKFLFIDITFILPKEELITLSGTPHKVDVTGFIKLLEDAVAEHLEIDDSYNFYFYTRKLIGKTGAIIVSVDDSLTFEDISNVDKYL